MKVRKFNWPTTIRPGPFSISPMVLMNSMLALLFYFLWTDPQFSTQYQKPLVTHLKIKYAFSKIILKHELSEDSSAEQNLFQEQLALLKTQLEEQTNTETPPEELSYLEPLNQHFKDYLLTQQQYLAAKKTAAQSLKAWQTQKKALEDILLNTNQAASLLGQNFATELNTLAKTYDNVKATAAKPGLIFNPYTAEDLKTQVQNYNANIPAQLLPAFNQIIVQLDKIAVYSLKIVNVTPGESNSPLLIETQNAFSELNTHLENFIALSQKLNLSIKLPSSFASHLAEYKEFLVNAKNGSTALAAKAALADENLKKMLKNSVEQSQQVFITLDQLSSALSDDIVADIQKYGLEERAAHTQLFLVGLFTLIALFALNVWMMLRVTKVRDSIEGQLKALINGDFKLPAENQDKIFEKINRLGQLFRNVEDQMDGIYQRLGEMNGQIGANLDTHSEIHAVQQEVIDRLDISLLHVVQAIDNVSEQSSTTLEHMSDTTSQLDKGRLVVNDTMNSIADLSEEVRRANEVIAKLEKDSSNITSVLDVIRGIAEQTNLLALNAAIEAARAGEHGRGFAVVADEVRTLAKRTQNSTEEIDAMISSLQLAAKTAVNSMEKSEATANHSVEKAKGANDHILMIIDSVKEITDLNRAIFDTSKELVEASSDIYSNMEQIKNNHSNEEQQILDMKSQQSSFENPLLKLKTFFRDLF